MGNLSFILKEIMESGKNINKKFFNSKNAFHRQSKVVQDKNQT